MSFFGFGAFSTPVGQLIERATDNAASAGNLALHLEVCDLINETDNGPKDAVAAIRKRLTSSYKNFHIINLTLTVLETCVKNCGLRFHVKIAQRDFLNDLLRIIQPKNNPPTIVKERVLGLIQYWADAFKGKPQLQPVVDMYEDLKAQGMEFPPIDLDQLAPVETTGRQGQAPSAPGEQLTVLGQQQRQSTAPPRGQRSRPRGPIGPLKPEQVAKLLSELDIVRRNIDIMSEIMTENEPGKESAEDFQLLEELNRSVHNMQSRVADLIERVQDEIILESTLQINDELNSVFVRYDRYLRNREALQQPPAAQESSGEPSQAPCQMQAQGGVATTSLSEPVASISYPSLDEQPPPSYEGPAVGQLIDLGSDISTPLPPQSGGESDIVSQLAQMGITGAQPPPAAAQPEARPPAVEQSVDEFDMFAKSRTAYANTGGSTYDDILVDQTQSLSAAVHGRSTAQPNTYTDLHEWLGQGTTSTTTAQQTAESATSAEFDQFLQQRSQEGDNLPAARHRPQMQKAEDQSDELFSL